METDKVQIIYDRDILKETPRIEVVPEIHSACWELGFTNIIEPNHNINAKSVCSCCIPLTTFIMSKEGFVLTKMWCNN